MAQFIFLNLFIMVIVETYEVLDDDSRYLGDECIEIFKNAWVKFDPQGTGVIELSKIDDLILQLDHPIGCKGTSSHLVLVSRRTVLLHHGDFRAEFDWILNDLLRLYVYPDDEHLERVDKAERAAAVNILSPPCKRLINRLKKKIKLRKRAEARA